MPSYKEQFNLNIFDHSSVGYCVLELCWTIKDSRWTGSTVTVIRPLQI